VVSIYELKTKPSKQRGAEADEEKVFESTFERDIQWL